MDASIAMQIFDNLVQLLSQPINASNPDITVGAVAAFLFLLILAALVLGDKS